LKFPKVPKNLSDRDLSKNDYRFYRKNGSSRSDTWFPISSAADAAAAAAAAAPVEAHRAARWYICIPEIHIFGILWKALEWKLLVHFGRPWNGNFWYILEGLGMESFGLCIS
jgi:hypothetical protein